MKCRYCLRILRVVPHSPVETEPHCTRRGCLWCAECHRGETAVAPPARLVYEARLASFYTGRHRSAA